MKKRKKYMHEGKLHEVPLGGPETDEEVAEEAERAKEEAMQESDERERVETAMKEEGFISAEDRRKKTKTDREKWLMFRETLFKEHKK